MTRRRYVVSRILALVAVALLAMSVGSRCEAGSFDLLYRFCQQPRCADGASPSGRLLLDRNGNLYGTTAAGGAHQKGTVFQLSPDGTQTVLYSFCAQPGCSDGSAPFGGLVADAAGNLYGTTAEGGSGNQVCGNPLLPVGQACGTVFQLTPQGVETVLHSFCSDVGCADGLGASNLIIDGDGNLYGTGAGGGSGSGIVFELAPDGTYSILYSFCALTNCADGQVPSGGLARDPAGNLYGTTRLGGTGDSRNCGQGSPTAGCGVVFHLSPAGIETVLYNFCPQGDCRFPGSDGTQPNGDLIIDAQGNLYGTTSAGGRRDDAGTVFKVTPQGQQSVLYRFCSLPNCADGAVPNGGLIADAAGNLYGTTQFGGANAPPSFYPQGSGFGTVFQLSPSQTETVLFSFCDHKRCPAGSSPAGGVIGDAGGNLYGATAHDGGRDNSGAVYALIR